MEKEMLGLYVSDHPLLGFESALRRLCDVSIADLVEQGAEGSNENQNSGFVTVGGVVTGLTRRYTRKGELMATFTLVDLEAAIEVFVFPKTMSEYGMRIEEDAIVCIRGRLDDRDDEHKMIATEVMRPELQAEDSNAPIEVAVPTSSLTERMVDQLRDLVCDHPGSVPVHLRLGQQVIRLPAEFNVDPRGGLVGALRELLGANSISA
jgi:DNA polymerase III subunit alpha